MLRAGGDKLAALCAALVGLYPCASKDAGGPDSGDLSLSVELNEGKTSAGSDWSSFCESGFDSIRSACAFRCC